MHKFNPQAEDSKQCICGMYLEDTFEGNPIHQWKEVDDEGNETIISYGGEHE